MQFDWMIQCYPGENLHRDAPLMADMDRETILRGVDTAVDVGLGGLWAPDHFILGIDGMEYEVWTLLSALAERTDGVDLGPLVTSMTYRNPALLAKMATTVDNLSDGRVQLGLGAGWHEEEHRRYGFEFPDIDQRISRFEEGIQVINAMFEQETPTFQGEFYQIDGAVNAPGPVQTPRPPLVIGGAGPQMLRLVARYADEWNIEISARARDPSIEFLVNTLDEYIEEEGRDPDDVDRSWLGHVLVREDRETLEDYCDRIFPLPWGDAPGMDDEQLSDAAAAREKGDFFIGTPTEVVEQIREVERLGFDRLQLFFLDFPETRGMELFADEVMDEF